MLVEQLLVLVCSSSRAWMMAAVLQLSVVRTILFFVLLVLWADEKYDYGDVSGCGWLRQAEHTCAVTKRRSSGSSQI